jgi:hypothetical protein
MFLAFMQYTIATDIVQNDNDMRLLLFVLLITSNYVFNDPISGERVITIDRDGSTRFSISVRYRNPTVQGLDTFQ